MQTYSHALVNAALGKQLEKRGVRPKYWALVLGSLMPDAPLTVLTLNYIAQRGGFNAEPSEVFGSAYDALYFTDPVWIIGHSLFHSPFMIALYLIIGWYFGFRRGQQWAQWVFWFAVGNGLHSFADVFTHHNDGPLLLFPFEWNYRFTSPVSYWDRDHFGVPFAIGEHLLDLFLIGYFVRLWWTGRKRKNETIQPQTA